MNVYFSLILARRRRGFCRRATARPVRSMVTTVPTPTPMSLPRKRKPRATATKKLEISRIFLLRPRLFPVRRAMAEAMPSPGLGTKRAPR